ncbi:hypothetical protein SUGI_1152740 [Cryptomeria japonica]|nr:hypothetical protein SUGI_1152740 [Cryptomeria japonica]
MLILNPSLETFNNIPIWVRLPKLPLHFWVDPLFEEVGDALGDFLMVDNDSNEIYHSTFAHILVEIDTSKGLPTEISLNTSKGCWVQPLDYEGIPFRCKIYFKTGHAASHCGSEKKSLATSWWKGASVQHYTVHKKYEHHLVSQEAALDSQRDSPVVQDSQHDSPVVQELYAGAAGANGLCGLQMETLSESPIDRGNGPQASTPCVNVLGDIGLSAGRDFVNVLVGVSPAGFSSQVGGGLLAF